MDSVILLGQKNTLAEYMILSEHGRMILESVENGPLVWPTIEENGVTRTKKYAELSDAEKFKLIVYESNQNHSSTGLHLKSIPLGIITEFLRFMEEFNTDAGGETLHKYYLRFTQLINDMNIYNMKIEQFQVYTKFLNSLPPEWSKFVMDVKLVKDLHTMNFDQLHAYLKQHELHANELQQQFSPSQFGSIHPNQHFSSTYPSQPQFNHSSVPSSYPYQSQMNHQTSSVLQIAYQSPQVTTQQMTESPFMDSSFVVPVFSLGDDPIACLNKAMAFLTAIASSSYSGTGYKSNATSSGGNKASEQARIVKWYNCQGEGHMARQCTQPKRPRNAAWYKEKAMLAKAQEAGQILDEEQLAFLADLGVPDGQAVQTIIPNTAAFQTEDLDTYDSDCDDILNTQAVLMANISNYSSDVISEVPHSATYLNDMENQSVDAMQDFEQTPAAQQDSMILSVIEQMSEQIVNHVNNWEKANKEQNNESVTHIARR
ncbi:integrase, catalytic region, zinc finger, CCHC-type containing protein [Tanacetum coccineum]